ncbi:MAG: manganese-dependent inorganic pyrophosphatase, partial [Paracoccus denitrificans]
HLLAGGLKTKLPINITVRPLACTATIMVDLIGEDMKSAPDWVKGLALTCILSDTLEFRSPTTTPHDRHVAETLATELGIDIPSYAAEMFEAKSDVSAFDDETLLRIDSKAYEVGGKQLRISVLETTAPQVLLDRKAGLIAAMPGVAAADEADEVLLFVVDILNEQSTLLIPNSFVRAVAEASFGVTAPGDSVLLPGIVSRKKQIIPFLKV